MVSSYIYKFRNLYNQYMYSDNKPNIRRKYLVNKYKLPYALLDKSFTKGVNKIRSPNNISLLKRLSCKCNENENAIFGGFWIGVTIGIGFVFFLNKK
jgi:hypothetical protein